MQARNVSEKTAQKAIYALVRILAKMINKLETGDFAEPGAAQIIQRRDETFAAMVELGYNGGVATGRSAGLSAAFPHIPNLPLHLLIAA